MYAKSMISAFLIAFAMIGSTFAATPEQAKAMVDKALAHVKAVGPEKAYADFNTPGSPFFDGELYIYAYDMNGKNLALGGNPKMTGKELIDMKSADGKPLIRDLIELVKTKGSGWYEYKWANPETKKIQDKVSYSVKIPGTEAFLGCGFYK